MKKKPKPKVTPPVSQTPAPQFISLRNNLNQAVHLNIKDSSGKLIGIQLDSNSSKRWPRLPDYGPDVPRLLSRKVIRLEPLDS